MDSPPTQTFFNVLMTAFGTLLTAIGAVWWGKVAALEKERVNYVTHDDLERHLDKIAEERRAIATNQFNWHVENSRRLERIEDGLDKGLERIHDRIDDISAARPPSTRTRSTDRG